MMNDLNVSIYKGLKRDANVEYNKYQQNKLAFVNDMYNNEKTKEAHFKKLITFTDLEEEQDKDLYEMNKEKQEEILANFPTSSAATLRNYISVFKKYNEWAINKGLNPTGINPLGNVKANDFLENILYRALKKKYVTREKLKEMAEEALKSGLDVQDVATTILPFFGVLGANHYEMKNLKVEDLRDGYVVVNQEDGESRKVEIEEWAMEYLRDAADATEREVCGLDRTVKYKPSEYVLKTTKTDQITLTSLTERIKKVSGSIGLGRTINATSLYKSGMYQLIKDKLQEEGREQATENDFKFAVKSFGASETSWWRLKEDLELIAKYNAKNNK